MADIRILVTLSTEGGAVDAEAVRSSVHQAIHAMRQGNGLSADDDGWVTDIDTEVLDGGLVTPCTPAQAD